MGFVPQIHKEWIRRAGFLHACIFAPLGDVASSQAPTSPLWEPLHFSTLFQGFRFCVCPFLSLAHSLNCIVGRDAVKGVRRARFRMREEPSLAQDDGKVGCIMDVPGGALSKRTSALAFLLLKFSSLCFLFYVSLFVCTTFLFFLCSCRGFSWNKPFLLSLFKHRFFLTFTS